MRIPAEETVADLVAEHVAAFNAHDAGRLTATLHEDVAWRTGQDSYSGRGAVAALFDDELWELDPRLDVRRLVVSGDVAAVECVEHLVMDGERLILPIAVFFDVRDGAIARVRVYREGSADLPERTDLPGASGGEPEGLPGAGR